MSVEGRLTGKKLVFFCVFFFGRFWQLRAMAPPPAILAWHSAASFFFLYESFVCLALRSDTGVPALLSLLLR